MEGVLGLAKQVAPKAAVVTTIGGQAVTIDYATLIAGLEALAKIDFGQIKTEFEAGQVVTAGVIAVDDALKVLSPLIPTLVPAQKILDLAVFVGTHSLAHNSGENGIGADPAGSGNVTF